MEHKQELQRFDNGRRRANGANLLRVTYLDIAAQLYRRIEEERVTALLKQYELAERAGISPQTYNRLIKGKINDPSFWMIVNIARVIGTRMDDLLTFPGDDRPMYLLPEWYSNDMPIDQSKPVTFALDREKFIEVDFDYPQPYHRGPVDVGLSAAGAPIDADRDEADVLNPIRRDVASGRYVVVRVKGDSMLPRLKDGDLVVVDTLDKEIGPRRVMAVYVYGEGSMLGVVHRVGGQLIVTKANTDYPPRILGEPETFLIQGRVTKRLEEDFEG